MNYCVINRLNLSVSNCFAGVNVRMSFKTETPALAGIAKAFRVKVLADIHPLEK